MKELRNSFRWKSPPYATHTARTIPEGSTVRRRLFADDGPAEPPGNPNMINSAADVDRMLQDDMERAERRWRFDVQREEPMPNDALSGMPRDYHREVRNQVRERRMLEAFASRRNTEIDGSEKNKLRKPDVSFDEPDMSYIASLGTLDNFSNNLMDGTEDYHYEGLQHWNFDFDNKMPTAGAVSWQQVGSHWVGNKPESFTRLVLYPTETKNAANTSISHEEHTNGKADKSVLKPTDKIEHLLTNNVCALYGDWKREMKIGIKAAFIVAARRGLDRDIMHDMTLLQHKNQYNTITKWEAIAMIRDENINYDNDNSEDYNSDDDEYDTDISEDSNSTPKKSSNLLKFAREE